MNPEREQSLLENFLKLTAFIPIVGVLLYSLGWNYWSVYFGSFGISESLISLSIETIIVTTWQLVVATIMLTSFSIIHFLENRHKNLFPIISSLFAIYTSIVIALADQISTTTFFLSFGIGIFVFLTLTILENKKIIVTRTISRTNYLIFFCIIVYLFGIYFYRNRGEKNAIKFKKNYKEDVEVILDSGERSYGKLITNMQSKYFILIEDSNCNKIVIIINEQNVRQVNLK